jgi:hypothetical protein
VSEVIANVEHESDGAEKTVRADRRHRFDIIAVVMFAQSPDHPMGNLRLLGHNREIESAERDFFCVLLQ